MPYQHGQEPPNSEQRLFNNPFVNHFLSPHWNQPEQYPGPPGQGPFSPPQQFPEQGLGGQSNNVPQTPPPPFTPEQPQMQTKAVDPGAIRGCLFRFTYVWTNRDAFWFYPTFVGRNSVAGFRWSRFRWVYFGIDLYSIQSFQCF